MNRRPLSLTSVTLFVAALAGATSLLAKNPPPSRKLARPPKWPADVIDTFYPDARTKLVGSRPDYQKLQTAAAAGHSSDLSQAGAAKGGGTWSKLIDADTIETEIKRLGPEVAKAAKSPSEFKGGGYKDCRRHFSELAVLLAIAAEFDGDVRWQDAAPALRDAFARAGHNCKAASDQAFQEAAQRKQDLTDLIAGTRPKAAAGEPKTPDWPKISDRPPLMQRMNIAHEDRLKKWLANKSEYTTHHDDVHLEAQLVAAIAEVIGREGYEYADDDQYKKFAADLRQAATDVAESGERNNFEAAQQANNRMTKACADCHEAYRQ